MKDQSGIPEDLKQKADNAYCSFIEEMRKPGCLGAEYKIERGIFTKDNLEAFKKAYTLYGKHVAYSDAEQIVASQAQQINELREALVNSERALFLASNEAELRPTMPDVWIARWTGKVAAFNAQSAEIRSREAQPREGANE